MFTGLIREIASVESFINDSLKIKASYRPNIGDSVAVNGVCLTVFELGENTFSLKLSNETKSMIAHENLSGLVHIEPAMRASDRLDGHFVQGHVDGIGEVVDISKDGVSINMLIKVPKELRALMIPKGSVTIDGVSLTINSVLNESIRLTLIPHTLEETLFKEYKLKRRVNIESDMIVRSLFHILKNFKKDPSWDEVERWMHLY